MSDLADALLLSRGGATRLVAKAEEDGLVTREIPPDDRRATFAVLTDAGRAVAERGFPVYVEVVQRLFQDFVTDDEAEVLVRIWNRVLEGNDMACGPVIRGGRRAAAARLAAAPRAPGHRVRAGSRRPASRPPARRRGA